MRLLTFPSLLAALAMLGACVSYGPKLPEGFVSFQSGDQTLLADAQGLSLYIFDLDLPDISNCYGDCATNWPPVVAPEGAQPVGDFTITPRKDGANQWVYKGMPLYRFIKDKKAGDITGDGVRNVWHLVVLSKAGEKKEGGSDGGY